MLTDIDEKTNLKRRLSIDDIYQISVHLDRRCQRRRPTCQIVTDDGRQVMTKTHMTFRPRELKNDIMLTVLNYLSMCAYIHIITTVITAKQPPFSARLQSFFRTLTTHLTYCYGFLPNKYV